MPGSGNGAELTAAAGIDAAHMRRQSASCSGTRDGLAGTASAVPPGEPGAHSCPGLLTDSPKGEPMNTSTWPLPANPPEPSVTGGDRVGALVGQGVSVWLDSISRGQLGGGGLAALVRASHVT